MQLDTPQVVRAETPQLLISTPAYSAPDTPRSSSRPPRAPSQEIETGNIIDSQGHNGFSIGTPRESNSGSPRDSNGSLFSSALPVFGQEGAVWTYDTLPFLKGHPFKGWEPPPPIRENRWLCEEADQPSSSAAAQTGGTTMLQSFQVSSNRPSRR